jgi:hypothetical protein
MLDAARLGPASVTHDGFDSGDELLRMAGLGEPVVSAHLQGAHALCDRRRARADDDAVLRPRQAQALEPPPGPRTQDSQVDDESVEGHRGDLLRGESRRQHAVAPFEALQALCEHYQKARVIV